MSWVNAVDSKTAKATAASVGLAGLIPLMVYLDSQHASAADVVALESTVNAFIVDSYEKDIGRLDDMIAEAESNPNLEQWERESLARKKARREQYIRKLDRLRTE